MKLHITVDQLNELSPEAGQRLWDWWTPQEEDAVVEGDPQYRSAVTHFHSWLENWEAHKEGTIDYDFKDGWMPQLSIGQMIEFLRENPVIDRDREYRFESLFWSELRDEWVVRVADHTGDEIIDFENRSNLCDALWEAVKDALNGATFLSRQHAAKA